ncbi:hypothetical protein NF556_06525 [Ornithinimicrobium faecis]|uniref:Transcriptional regulator n=1 Tax=Ornithinimicrobium faecis TaxID=2934158 RepID=A0ABY4YWY8_9MICO|nr:hypothetical protein [Ornithinimicrobium sp. HY1793]USQ81296.1 hypothetical protein NF556_06525 [Ornithinimicrobium sp. HY1793]
MSTSERAELLILQAVRLTGVADEGAVLDRALLGEHQVREVLEQAAADGLVEQFRLADVGGWVLTESGSVQVARLLSQEVQAADARAVLSAALERFEQINGPFVERVAQWQLQSTLATTTGFGGADDAAVGALLADLTQSGDDLRSALADLVVALPRFGRYPFQFSAALDRARGEGLRWVTGVGLLSCHAVWAEVHQDLLSSLGLARGRTAG